MRNIFEREQSVSKDALVKKESVVDIRTVFDMPEFQQINEEAIKKYEEKMVEADQLVLFLTAAMMQDEYPAIGGMMTGDLKQDAEKFFESIGASKLIPKIKGGEDPKKLLMQLQIGMEAIVSNKDKKEFAKFYEKAKTTITTIKLIMHNSQNRKNNELGKKLFNEKRFIDRYEEISLALIDKRIKFNEEYIPEFQEMINNPDEYGMSQDDVNRYKKKVAQMQQDYDELKLKREEYRKLAGY